MFLDDCSNNYIYHFDAKYCRGKRRGCAGRFTANDRGEQKREARAMKVGTVQGARRRQRTLRWQRAASRLLAVPR